MGPRIDPETDVGPLITPDAVDNVERKVQDAISNGANCITRGGGEGVLQKAHDLGPHFSPDGYFWQGGKIFTFKENEKLNQYTVA